MSEGVFKAPKSKKSMEIEDEELATTSKRPRTAEDFYMFCKFILEYENYDVVKQEELREKSGSPIGSTGSLPDSIKSESTSGSISDDRKASEVDLAKTGSQEWNWNGIHFSGGPQFVLVQFTPVMPVTPKKYRDANELLGCRERLSQQRQASLPIAPGLLWQEVKWAYYEDSYDLITCYCMKPFAGRPMIECSKCLTWIHLSCAKIKKTNIPEVFICMKCKDQSHSERRPSLRSISGSSPTVRTKKKLSV